MKSTPSSRATNDLVSRVGTSLRNSLKAKQVCATKAPTTIATNQSKASVHDDGTHDNCDESKRLR